MPNDPGARPGRRLRKVALATLALVTLLVVGYLALAGVLEIGGVKAPAVQVAQPVRLDGQGWSAGQAHGFHTRSQGTKILPLAWFLALEQPVLTPFSVAPFAARDYLARFGFHYEGPRPEKAGAAPDLPIGFAVAERFVAPYANPPMPEPTRVVGLTCAACHTGRLDVKRPDGAVRGVVVEGGSAMINLSLFQGALGRALFFTTLPGPFRARFDRFAARVLDAQSPRFAEEKEKLRANLGTYVRLGLASKDYARENNLNTLPSGFARTDALGLIGNRVFGALDDENQTVTDAPVNFPHLWDTSWFDWVQYNASIRTPMARNIGEALGVGALVNLSGKVGTLYDSTVDVEGLAWMEDQLGGDAPFAGLRPPKWSEFVARAFEGQTPPPAYVLDDRKVAEGAKLYRNHCQQCHLPPRAELAEDLASDEPKYWTNKDEGSDRRFLRLRVVDLSWIGTDPNQALNFRRRAAVTPEPAVGPPNAFASLWEKQGTGTGARFASISAEEGLFRITSIVRWKKYDELYLFPRGNDTDPAAIAWIAGRRKAFDRHRFVPAPLDLADEEAVTNGRGMDWVIRANLGYKARPLDGVWATPPFLHNGSVPTLRQVLLPAAQRDQTYYLGSTRFDPDEIGYERHHFSGAFRMDTTLRGNRNTGHEFRNLTLEELEAAGTPWDGRETTEQRWARVLQVEAGELAGWTADARWQKVREATARALASPHTRPFRGVLGPELREDERRCLIEYLKSL